MIHGLLLAFAQLFDRPILRVLIKSLALTLLLFVFGWWLLFRAVAVAVIGIFADEVVAAVEAKHYPQAHAAARDVPLGRGITMGVGSAARTIGFNLLLSPLYLM